VFEAGANDGAEFGIFGKQKVRDTRPPIIRQGLGASVEAGSVPRAFSLSFRRGLDGGFTRR
jgi:hypothetical protein